MSNGLTGNGELEHLGSGDSQLPDRQLPTEEVDKLADELVTEYSNPKFRKWYCSVIYEFGFERVAEWRRKAATGHTPGGLFGHYVKQARLIADDNAAGPGPEPSLDTGFTPDIIYPVRGDETDEELSRNIDETLRIEDVNLDMSAWDEATGNSPGVDDGQH
jgi:hypothetical protein